MATQLPFTYQQIEERRDSLRQEVEAFFGDNIGIRFSTRYLHQRFGSSFRTRKHEINKDPFSSLTIQREWRPVDRWVYWAEPRG